MSDQIVRCSFGPGSEFDEHLMLKHMILGLGEPFKAQKEIIQCQADLIV